jgi:asparagine synthase (glutamine-hydrolysing)
MTGIAGGTVTGSQLERMGDALDDDSRHVTDQFEAGGYGLSASHHGDRDVRGHTFWADGHVIGAIDGAITNRDELGWDDATIFRRLLRAPERTLTALDGPFTVACVDADDHRIILATDKIGSRTPYYATESGFMFASGLAPLLETLDDPTVDEQGVSDMLLMGHMWSDTTLLEGVNSLHPASLLEYHDGKTSERRYWRPDYTPAEPTEEYFHRLTNSFQGAVDRAVDSIVGDAGLWLSGGLDSRATVSELARNHEQGDLDSLATYTYDANPGGGINPQLAREVAETLDLPIETVQLSPDQFLSVLETVVDSTDGMVKWHTLINLSSVFNIQHREPDVLMEGIVGELVGQHLSRHHLREASSLVDSMYRSEAALEAKRVRELMDVPVDPMESFRREARRTDESSFEAAVVDTHFQNYYPRLAHASNPVPRTQVGTRVPYADEEFLSEAAKLPVSWRMGSLPLSNGDLIYGVVKPKLRMIRALDAELSEIPYERSRVKPVHPYPVHVAGFFASTALARLTAQPTYGGKSKAGEWYRTHDAFRERLDGLLDDACDRALFDADSVRKSQRRHLDGEAENIGVLSAITTVELWLQRHFD